MFELVTALRALRDPARAAQHLPWVREALPVAREIDLGSALALTPPEGYMPDFLTPPPTGPLASFGEELATVRATPAHQITCDVEYLREEGHSPPELEAFIADPSGEVDRMCDALAEFWSRALEPHWPRVRSVLEEDVRYRARRLAEGGPALLFGDLHPSISWHGDRIESDQVYCDDVELRGRGLLLMPSAFQVTRPTALTEPPWQPTLIYPCRGVAMLWEEAPSGGPEALAKLVGGTRARLLSALDAPRTTTELAGSLGMSPGGVSQHLSVLRDSGLVCGEREGRAVLYLRTKTADRLLAEAGAQG
jgi:DNA-binding transcriptional ArsR family regulator